MSRALKLTGWIPLVAGLGLTVGGGMAVAGTSASEMRAVESTSALEVRVVADVSDRKLYVYNNSGNLMNTFPIAVGEPEHPTPRGDFTIDRIEWNPDWTPPDVEWAEDESHKAPGHPDNPMKGAKLFFKYPDYYIHGTDDTHTLGEAASHGCLRMKPVDVENLAEFIQKAGGEPRSDEWFASMKSSDTNHTTITLPDPVPMVVRD